LPGARQEKTTPPPPTPLLLLLLPPIDAAAALPPLAPSIDAATPLRIELPSSMLKEIQQNKLVQTWQEVARDLSHVPELCRLSHL